MFRSRFALVVLAGLTAACSHDITSPTPPQIGSPSTDAAEHYASEPGILAAANQLRSGDRMIYLTGWQTRMFAAFVGAEVLVEGRVDDEVADGLIIREFQLLSLADGTPVLDGVLSEHDQAFFISTGDGTATLLPAAGDDLARYVGHRVWVTRPGYSQILRYGSLEL